MASAVNKAAQLGKAVLPPAEGAAAARAGGGEAAAAAEPAAAAQTMLDCLPDMKQLLQQHADLVKWAEDTMAQHWTAGPAMKK